MLNDQTATIETPPGTLRANGKDAGLLIALELSSTARAFRRGRVVGPLLLVMLALLALELAFIGFMAPAVLLPVLVFVLGVAMVPVVLVVARVPYRLADRRRLVLLAEDRGSGLDVVFLPNGRVTIANHGRLRGRSSAPELRERVGAWLDTIPGMQLYFRAQNSAVAKLYQRQFPQLVRGSTDLRGRVELTASTAPAPAEQTS